MELACQNKFVNLVQVVGFITKKFVTMHGHTNVKFRKIVLEIFKTRLCDSNGISLTIINMRLLRFY